MALSIFNFLLNCSHARVSWAASGLSSLLVALVGILNLNDRNRTLLQIPVLIVD